MPTITTKRVGGIRFIKLGRFGMSFWQSRSTPEQPAHSYAGLRLAFVLLVGIVISELAFEPAPNAFDNCIEAIANGDPAITGCRG